MRGVIVGLGVVGLVVVIGAAFSLGKSKPTPVAPPKRRELPGGLVIEVKLDGKAWRWTVLFQELPMATGLSVLEAEAFITAENWIKLLEAHVEKIEEVAVEGAAERVLDDDPDDVMLLSTSTEQFCPPFMECLYQVEISTSKTGVDGDHFRWVIYRDNEVVFAGWSATPADARNDAYNWVLVDLYKRGATPWMELL